MKKQIILGTLCVTVLLLFTVCIPLFSARQLQETDNGKVMRDDHSSASFDKREDIPPIVTITYAGNLLDRGGPYFIPPAENGPVAAEGYYTNDSKQSESWIIINCQVTDDTAVEAVWLQWLNGTTWTNWTYKFAQITPTTWQFNSQGVITTKAGYRYSFNVVANDTSGNSRTVPWNKTGLNMNGKQTRRYVQLNNPPQTITYAPLYFYDAVYQQNDCRTPTNYTFDRMHHDQGVDGTQLDTGYLRTLLPLHTMSLRYSPSFIGYWFDETVCTRSLALGNIYYHFWYNTTHNEIDQIGWKKDRKSLDQNVTNAYSTTTNNARSSILYGANFYLDTRLLMVTTTMFSDNDIYELSVKFREDNSGNPIIISNRSIQSFVLLNVPDNKTLNETYVDSDSDGLTDWKELYRTYTNPFLSDTDNDGFSDNVEYQAGTDPNNYQNHPSVNQPPYVPSNPSPVNGATGVDVNADLGWTGGDPNGGDTVTYDIFFGTVTPPPKIVSNQSGISYNLPVLQYNTRYYWKIVSWDNHGASTPGPIWTFLTMQQPNNPPYIPSNPNPANGATGVNINADLSWTGGDPDSGDTVTYDVFFGTSSPPPKVVGNQSATTYNLPTLSYNTRYYWKIVSWDNHGASTAGTIWTFITMQAPNQPPYVPSNPSPANGATGVGINADLSWTGGDPDVGDTVTYDVFFGTSSPPPKVVGNQSATTYNLPTLLYNTRYYWKIVSWDNHGASTAGTIWTFITMQAPNQPPYVPSNPSPANGATGVDINADLSWTGGDPDVGDIVKYDIFFGTVSPPPKIVSNQSSTSYVLPTLLFNTRYYWKIVSWDNHGASTPGPIWTFVTMQVPNQPPYVPSNPSPANGATGVGINADLSWTGGDPDVGDTVTYDVFFGTSNPPPKVIGNQSTTTYILPILLYNTQYYWKIVSWDNHGASRVGPIWSFTTEQEPNNPPYAPSNPSPADQAIDIDINADISWTGGDPDPGDTVTYDIFFGKFGELNEVISNYPLETYDPGMLDYDATYYWYIVSHDNHGAETIGPVWNFTTIKETINNPPSTPILTGPSAGTTGVEYVFSVNATDPEGNQVLYNVSWGDGNYSDWLGPYPSDEIIEIPHLWTTQGIFDVKVKAKDVYDAESDWSEILPINISLFVKHIEINNIKVGYLYFRFFSDGSYGYINLLDLLGISVVFGFALDVNATVSDSVDSVEFNITRLFTGEQTIEIDEDMTDGATGFFTQTTGLFSIAAHAFDVNGTEIGNQTIDFVVFIKPNLGGGLSSSRIGSIVRNHIAERVKLRSSLHK